MTISVVFTVSSTMPPILQTIHLVRTIGGRFCGTAAKSTLSIFSDLDGFRFVKRFTIVSDCFFSGAPTNRMPKGCPSLTLPLFFLVGVEEEVGTGYGEEQRV